MSYVAGTTYIVYSTKLGVSFVDANDNTYTLDTSLPNYTYSNSESQLKNGGPSFNFNTRNPTLTSMTSVVLGTNSSSIGQNAFAECGSLASIYIPNTITSIGYGAFNGSNLKSVTIPDSVETIAETAFYDNVYLTTIIMGEGVKTIGANAFENLGGFTTLGTKNIPTLYYGTNQDAYFYFYNTFGKFVIYKAYPPIKIQAEYSIKFYKSTTEIDTSESATGTATGTGDTQLLAFEDVNNTVTTDIHDLILALETAPGFDDTVIPTSTVIEIDYTFLSS